MKNAKKVLAMVIVLALAISMAIPASAGSITINGVSEDISVDYRLWKMASLTYSDMGTPDNKADDTYAYTAEAKWVNFFKTTAATYFEYDEVSGAVTKKAAYNEAAAATVASLALEYATTVANDVAVTKTANSAINSTTAAFTGIDDGFYLVDSTLGTKLILDTVVGDISLNTKNTAPTIDKNIVVGSNEVKSNDVEIGDTVNYKITVTKQAGASNYVVEDTLSTGLTFTTGSAKVSFDNGATATAIEPGVDGQKLTFTIEGEENLADNQTIVITYDAVVNDSALINVANTNSAVLKYGNNAIFKSEPSITNTYTWDFDLVKYTGDQSNPLAGATFSLYEENPFTNASAEPLKFKLVDGVYRLAADQTATTGVETVFVDNADGEGAALTAGQYNIAGLDSGKTYYLKEIAAPNGYNLLTSATAVTITTGGTAATTLSNETTTVYVENNTGAELPSTGSTGTVIFVTVGSFLVVAMGVLLVVRKRMSKVVYTR